MSDLCEASAAIFKPGVVRRSVPTADLQSWWSCGWAYVSPDFSNSGHSIIEWISEAGPGEPTFKEIEGTFG